MPLLQPTEAPPPTYYAANVRRVLDYVHHAYGSNLPEPVQRFLTVCGQLQEPGLRLYARLITRKGPLFSAASLAYAEIPQIDLALQQLEQADLIERQQPAPADRLLALLKVAELKHQFPVSVAATSKLGLRRKDELLAHVLSQCSDQQIQQRLGQQLQWLQLRQLDSLRLCLLLYFGNRQQDFSTFVMQDLGMLSYETYALQTDTLPLNNASALAVHLRLRTLSDLTYRLPEFPDLASELANSLLIALLDSLPEAASRVDRRMRDGALNRLGQWFERTEQPSQSLRAYAPAQLHPARERRVRLLCKNGEQAAASALQLRINQKPWNAAEAEFGRTFDVAKGARRRNKNRQEIATTTLTLECAQEGRIEDFALDLLTQQTTQQPSQPNVQFITQGWHCENALPRSLAGLCYWDEVFSAQPGAFNHPYQTGPLDLFWDDFAPVRAKALAAQHQRLQQPGALAAQLRHIVAAKSGTACRLVNWSLCSTEFVEHLLANIPAQDLLALADFMIHHLYAFRNGFPDLLIIYGPNHYEFVEVKSHNDQLQAAQRSWFAELSRLQLPARVLKFQRP